MREGARAYAPPIGASGLSSGLVMDAFAANRSQKMRELRTGRRFEIVFGPGLDLSSETAVTSLDGAFEQVCRGDAVALTMSTASDGLKVIGSDVRSAIDAGREVCSIHCRVFDRSSNQELSSPDELARAPTAAAWSAPVAEFDRRSAAAGGKSKTFKLAGRRLSLQH